MQIFLSHSLSFVKSEKVSQNILVHGSMRRSCCLEIPYRNSIESTIKSEPDYVLMFVDNDAAESAWVYRELEWTLPAEKIYGRTILLPIVIDGTAFTKLANVEIQNRKYLRLKDYFESSVRALSESIVSELFALICRDVDRLRNPKPKTPMAMIADADLLLRAQAATIQKAVFPHRRSNPISKERLLEVMNALGGTAIAADDLDVILSSVAQRNLIPGLAYDGFEAFLIEEHARWKAEVERTRKEKIGRKAAGLIQNGMKVFIDAGSTTEEVIRVICRKIENRALNKITIGTTSINIADMISDCCVKMGFDDDFSAVRLFVPGGQVRPSTQAIVPAFGSGPREILNLSDSVGGFDLCLVGVNGVDFDGGFTTHENSEAQNKIDIMGVSRARVIIGDSSKIGLVPDRKFADFGDDLRFVVDSDRENERLQNIVKAHNEKVILV